MSGAAKLFVPEVRLAKLVRKPGGKRISDALVDADAGIAGLRQAIVDDVRTTLTDAQAFLARCGDPDAQQMNELYLLVSRPIGTASLCGMAEIDQVLLSLAGLLDILKTGARWDREPVELHLNALALFLSDQAPGADAAGTIVEGLQKVVRRYA
jgi:hypothetical protein